MLKLLLCLASARAESARARRSQVVPDMLITLLFAYYTHRLQRISMVFDKAGEERTQDSNPRPLLLLGCCGAAAADRAC